ncbi:hypothetical protein ACIA8C_25570 [Nocardia sp. NPDC051321]
MGIFRKTTDKTDEQPANATDQNTKDADDAKKDRKRRRLLGGYYGSNGGS